MTRSKEKSTLFKFLDAINYTKEDMFDETTEKEYNPYVINHFLSGNLDSIIHANEMNIRPFLDKRMQFDYLKGSLRKRKRFAKWLKDEKSDDLSRIMEYYNYSRERAKETMRLLSEDDLNYIRQKTFKGGTSK